MSARKPSPGNNRGRPENDQGSDRTDGYITTLLHGFPAFTDARRWLANSSQAISTRLERVLPAGWWPPSKRTIFSFLFISLLSSALLILTPYVRTIGPPWSTWLIDSTTRFHTTNDLHDFSIYEPFTVHADAFYAGVHIGAKIEQWDVVGSGIVELEYIDFFGLIHRSRVDALYVPEKAKRLSLGLLLSEKVELKEGGRWAPYWMSLILDARRYTNSIRARAR